MVKMFGASSVGSRALPAFEFAEHGLEGGDHVGDVGELWMGGRGEGVRGRWVVRYGVWVVSFGDTEGGLKLGPSVWMCGVGRGAGDGLDGLSGFVLGDEVVYGAG